MTLASFAAQLVNGLASASASFLVAAGLTLVFGVTRVVNFAHGSMAMVGAYVAVSLLPLLDPVAGAASFWLAVIVAAAAGALFGVLLERVVLARLYAAPEMLQLTATFGVVLVVRDAVLWLAGAEDRLGPRVPGLAGRIEFAGVAIPQYDLALIAIGIAVLAALYALVERTRFGMVLRACAENRSIAAALGIDPVRVYVAVFALGGALAALAGALALPREPATLSMDLAIVADAFVVTVMGGLGSIGGAFLAAVIIGVAKALCIGLGTVEVAGIAVAFPKLTLVLEFALMALVLAIRPTGLFGRALAAPAVTVLPEQRAWWPPLGRGDILIAALLAAALAAVAVAPDTYLRVLATDVAVAALFVASLQLLLGAGGVTSFGHAAHFGFGAYAAAIAARAGWPLPAAFAAGVAMGAASAALVGALCARLSGVYLAMLTLAFAQIAWSIAWQWDSVTGGSNGLVGLWPPPPFDNPDRYFLLAALVAALGYAALVAIARTPWGRALRAARDSPQRAAASGLAVGRLRWEAFVVAGAFAGLAGALHAFAKGSISPETLAIPRSVDALVMALLGGINAWFGPAAGALVFTGLADWLSRAFEYWRGALGLLIIALVLLFPRGIAGLLPARRPGAGPRSGQARSAGADGGNAP